jgi:hypothetical protein
MNSSVTIIEFLHATAGLERPPPPGKLACLLPN